MMDKIKNELQNAFEEFWRLNDWLHDYNKSIAYFIFKNSALDKNELILDFQARYSGALQTIAELTSENENLKKVNKDLLDRVSSR